MNNLDKWAAEQCGVGFTKNHHKVIVAWFTGDIDNREYRNYEWTLNDARCREIVREHFLIDTNEYGQHWEASGAFTAGSCISTGRGKTIAEAELACIRKIKEASDE